MVGVQQRRIVPAHPSRSRARSTSLQPSLVGMTQPARLIWGLMRNLH